MSEVIHKEEECSDAFEERSWVFEENFLEKIWIKLEWFFSNPSQSIQGMHNYLPIGYESVFDKYL